MSRSVGGPGASKRQARARRACVAVLTGLAAFALLQLGLGVGVETWLPGVRDPLYATRLDRIRRRLRAGLEQPRTVIVLGTSRTLHGFRAGEEERAWGNALGRPVAAFNFGVTGGSPLTELLMWRRLRRDGVRPDLLLVEVLPAQLSAQAPPGDFSEVRLPTDRLGWHDLPLVERYAAAARPGLRGDWLRSWVLPWYAHRFSLVSRVKPTLLPPEYRLDSSWNPDAAGGLVSMDMPPTPELRFRAVQLASRQYHALLTDFRLGGPACEALRELLASCRKEGVPVGLMVMPEGPVFRSWYPPEAWPQIQAWLEQLSREYDAPLVNAREWIDEDDFMDSHHLLAAGAARFKERLGRECIVPMLRGAKGAGP